MFPWTSGVLKLYPISKRELTSVEDAVILQNDRMWSDTRNN